MQFYAIKTRSNRPSRCFYKSQEHMLHIKKTNLIRNRIRRFAQRVLLAWGQRAGRDDTVGRIHLRCRYAAAMEHLHDRDRAFFLDRLNDRLPGFYLALVVRRD